MGWVFRPIFISYLIPRCNDLPPSGSCIAVMTEQLNPEDWAWQISAEVYRLNLYSRLTGKADQRIYDPSPMKSWLKRSGTVSLNETKSPIAKWSELATQAALETYYWVVSSIVKRSRVRLRN